MQLFSLRLQYGYDGPSETKKKSYGIPDGLIVYSDLNVPAAPLFSKRSRLTGKPDYILRKENQCIPVEVKSGKGPHPHQSQVLQLAAYCQILEDTSGVFVPEGILVYNNVPYTIRFDPKLRFELESMMKTMRASLRSGVVKRNHHEPGKVSSLLDETVLYRYYSRCFLIP